MKQLIDSIDRLMSSQDEIIGYLKYMEQREIYKMMNEAKRLHGILFNQLKELMSNSAENAPNDPIKLSTDATRIAQLEFQLYRVNIHIISLLNNLK